MCHTTIPLLHFSRVDSAFPLGAHVLQTKSIPALVCFSLPPALSDLKVFREKQEPISMVQYLSTAVRLATVFWFFSFLNSILFMYRLTSLSSSSKYSGDATAKVIISSCHLVRV